ncbi:SprT-like domain-containing protein [Stieleria sp. JC731]|uniref:SprT-like domain-containing protein n=1 Tax=Pirellulaceae TaxID=2691357 RepID=UPI001E40C23E|nr:SprT-like domain-containing protein [Stieleria sp. JC731]MCC9603540.1 SprT-like domain-containing protein [Stieleria sp. JC731]
MAKSKQRPTADTFSTLQEAYDFFNDQLWGGKLPQCMLLVHRKAGAHGYYWPMQFKGPRGKRIDEIALSPESMERTDREVLSTLVHEMAHLWQHHFGSPSAGYHNAEWADEMDRLGLPASDTGEPGGKRTGKSMSHYIKRNGLYAKAFTQWRKKKRKLKYCADAAFGDGEKAARKRASKTKYTCPECGQNAWAKPAAKIDCGDCGFELEPEEQG